jgi:hypothetical protein
MYYVGVTKRFVETVTDCSFVIRLDKERNPGKVSRGKKVLVVRRRIKAYSEL